MYNTFTEARREADKLASETGKVQGVYSCGQGRKCWHAGPVHPHAQMTLKLPYTTDQGYFEGETILGNIKMTSGKGHTILKRIA